MKGKVVAADAGSTGDIWATAHRAEHGFADIRRFEGLAPAILGQQAGGSDGDISGIPALIHYTEDKPALRHGEGVDDNRMIPRRAAESRPLWRQQGCEAPPCTLADVEHLIAALDAAMAV